MRFFAAGIYESGRLPWSSVLLAWCLLPLLLVAAEPSFQVGFPKWGETPRLVEYHWCEVPFEVINPTAGPVELVFAIMAAGEGEALYSKRLTVGAGASMRDSLMMVGERTKEYLATLSHVDGRLLQKQQVMSDFQNGFQQLCVYFVVDDPDTEGVSALAKNRDLGQRLIVTRSKSENLPEHLPGYGGASLVVLTSLNYAGVTAGQYRALEEFVASGGTLFVLGPAVLPLTDTPLGRLLPVSPLRVRRMASFPEIAVWGGAVGAAAPPSWPAGIDFVDSVASELALVPLRHGQQPAVAWQGYGLGRVAFCAFDPFDAGFRATASGTLLWRHLLAGVKPHPLGAQALYAGELATASLRLIGFSVPSVGTVRNLMIAYLAFVVGLFVLGGLLRRQVLSWVVAVACSLGLTFMVFAAADRQLEQQDLKSAIVVDLACQLEDGQAAVAGEKLVHLVSRQADRPDIRATNARSWLRSPAPEPGPVPAPRRVPAMLSIGREQSRSWLYRFDVHEKKAATFASPYQGRLMAGGASSPELVYGPDGPELLGCALPPSAPAAGARAYLLLESGLRRLRLRGRDCLLEVGGGGMVELDTVAKHFETFLATAELPRPVVAFLYKSPPGASAVQVGSGDYREHRQVVHLVPVRQRPGRGQLRIAAEQIVLSPAGKSSRALRWNNQWQESFLYGGSSQFYFFAELPLACRALQLDSLEINLEIANPSGSVKGTVEVLPFAETRSAEPEAGPVAGIKPVASSGTRLQFAGLAAAQVVNPVDGKILLRLVVSGDESKAADSSPTGASRWKINQFTVSGGGQL